MWMGGCWFCGSCQSQKSPTDSERCKFDQTVFFAQISVKIQTSINLQQFLFLFPMQRLYKKDAHDNFGRFTHIVDRPEVVLAKVNAFNLSDVSVSHIFIFIGQNWCEMVNLSTMLMFLLLNSWSTKNHLTWRRATTLDLKIHHNWLTVERSQRWSAR